MKSDKDRQRITLTLTKKVYDRLKKEAADTDRSLAGYIRWVLNEHLWELENPPR